MSEQPYGGYTFQKLKEFTPITVKLDRDQNPKERLVSDITAATAPDGRVFNNFYLRLQWKADDGWKNSKGMSIKVSEAELPTLLQNIQMGLESIEMAKGNVPADPRDQEPAPTPGTSGDPF